MPGNDNARPGDRPGAGASSTSSCLVDDRYFTADPEGRQRVRQIHELGPKPLGYLLEEIGHDPTNIRWIVERYAALDPGEVEKAGGRNWLRPTDLLRPVR
jgi:hypothetical protein